MIKHVKRMSTFCLMSCALSCGETPVEEHTAPEEHGLEDHVEHVEPDHSLQIHQVLGSAEIRAWMGSQRVGRVESEHGFRVVAMNFDGEEEALRLLQVRTLDQDGEVLVDWHEPQYDEFEVERASALLEFEQLAYAFEVRTAGALEFARIELSQLYHDHAAQLDDLELNEGASFDELTVITQSLSRPGHWIPPASVNERANTQRVPYTGAPSRCSGGTKAGTRELANFLKHQFVGAVSWQGYNCRANTATPGKLSVHSTGRAIDLFIPLHRGNADNDLGDPVANYLIMNAEALGIEYLIWDRAQWSGSRSSNKHRYYSGAHRHHDHLHIEVAPWAATRTGKSYPPLGAGGATTAEPKPPAVPQTQFTPLLGRFNGDHKDDLAVVSSNALGGWANNMYGVYGAAAALDNFTKQVALPVHMRNGDASKSYRHLVGDFNGDGQEGRRLGQPRWRWRLGGLDLCRVRRLSGL